MLHSLKDLENFAIGARDGHIGHVKDLYFDDDAWVVRYLVVDTGSWLSSRKVLISPMAIQHANWADRVLPVSLTKDQVEHSPNIDTNKPVSRQHEEQYLGYYGYPAYWGGDGLWGAGLYPYAIMPDYPGAGADSATHDRELAAHLNGDQTRPRNGDPHLRSGQVVVGYNIQATDGEIGHVDGLLFDEDTWAVRYLIVNTSNWWMGHQVLIAPQWVTGVHWAEETVTVSLTRDAIKTSPHYDPAVPLSRPHEVSLYQHYARSGYWAGGVRLEKEN